MCYKNSLYTGRRRNIRGRAPPALCWPRAHGAGQGQRCEVPRGGRSSPPGSSWPQLRTNSSPISPGLPSDSAAGPRTHGSAAEAPRKRVPAATASVLQEAIKKRKEMKNDYTELQIDTLEPKPRAAEARCALLPAAHPPAGVTGASPGPRWPSRPGAPGALREGRRHPPGRASTETTGELIKRARTHAEINKYFTRKKNQAHFRFLLTSRVIKRSLVFLWFFFFSHQCRCPGGSQSAHTYPVV